jgi:hypothetical protein
MKHEEVSKPKSSNLSEYINSPEGKAAFKAEIERQEAVPSKAFPGWDPARGIPPALREHIEISMFGRILRDEERRAGKLMPLDEEPE